MIKTKLFIIAFILFAITSSTLAQEKAKLNSWRGLVLNQTSVNEAKEKLKVSSKESTSESFKAIIGSKWFGDKKEKKFRKLAFRKFEGFDEVNLYFLDDYLVVIELNLQEDLLASSLIDAYENRFFPLVGNYIGMSPAELTEANRQIIYPTDGFPLEYYLASASNEAIGLAFASIGVKQRLKYLGAERIPATTLPGNVRKIQLVSRKLEIKKNINLLK